MDEEGIVWAWVKEGDMKTSVNNRDSGRTLGTLKEQAEEEPRSPQVEYV